VWIRQKNRNSDVSWPARRASGWLLENVRKHKVVKVQATEETCKPSKNWRTRVGEELVRSLVFLQASILGALIGLHVSKLIPDDMMNDHLILDCCQFFLSRLRNTILCTADHNLCLIAESVGT